MRGKKKAEKKWDIRDISLCICLGILIFMMLTAGLRFLTRQILVERLGLDNGFTRLVFLGAEEMGKNAVIEDTKDLEGTKGQASELEINWEAQYPFQEEEVPGQTTSPKGERLRQWNSLVESIEQKIGAYTGEGILGYPLWIRLERQYEKMIGWNLFLYDGNNEVIFLPDGYLTHIYPSLDVTEQIASVKELEYFCKQQGTDFLYVQSPFKISKYQDADFADGIDFSNQNADRLLEGLMTSGISCLDIRENIEEESLSHHALFYRTDHHWKIETGLWASKIIAERLNEEFGFHIETRLLERDQFHSVCYPNWFLGSQGKKVTMEQTEPEDINLLYPNYPTSFHYKIPSLALDVEGDFSVTYDMEQVETIDYMEKSPYRAFNHSDRPVIQIENQNQERGHLLFIKDSFVNCVAPFLALGVREVDVLDIRSFDGSVRSFIEEKKPDLVIVMYNPSSIREIDRETHTSTFDFR